jgi:hypothetical protein
MSLPFGSVSGRLYLQIAQALVKLGVPMHHRRAIVRHALPEVGQLEELVAVWPMRERIGQGTAIRSVLKEFRGFLHPAPQPPRR